MIGLFLTVFLLLAFMVFSIFSKSALMKKICVYFFLICMALAMIVPFYWMFVLSTHSTSDIYSWPPPFFFGENIISNFSSMQESVNIGRSFLNSSIVSISYTILVLLFSSASGYAFYVYNFPFKKKLFSLMLLTMMLPWTVSIVPWFFMMVKFGWTNNFLALIVPTCANAFSIFWMKQYCQNNVPLELVDAARIDGCSEWTIFFRIIIPILLPAISALGIMQFTLAWNDFMAPLLILKDSDLHTLPIMLRYMVGDPLRGSDVGALMLANSISVLPLLLVFLFASKYFLGGLTAGAIKE